MSGRLSLWFAGMLAAGVVWLAGIAVAMGDSVSFTTGCGSWTVPIGVTSVSIAATGAPGASVSAGGQGGAGGELSGILRVNPGEALYVCADVGPGGGGGPGTPPGGTGGGASGVSIGTDFSSPVLVAAGGGGGGGGGSKGGDAGPTPGAPPGNGGPGRLFNAAGPGAGGPGGDGLLGGGGGGGGAGYQGGGGGGGGLTALIGGGGGGGGANYCAASLTNCSPLSSTAPPSSAPHVIITYSLGSAPLASITSPVTGATYVLGKAVYSSFTCTEGAGGSGIFSCSDQSNQRSGSRIDTTKPGPQTFTVTAASSDGETSNTTVAYNVAAPPAIRLTFPESGAVYVRGQRFVSEFRCVDGTGGPGIASCVDNRGRVSDSFVDTSRVGTHVFVVRAASADGLTTTAISRYTISRRATLSKLKIRHGIITFTVKAPAGGTVAALAATSFKRSPIYAGSKVATMRSGKVPMIVVPSRAGIVLLQRHRRLTIRLVITYTPSGGLPQTVAALTRKITP